MPSRVEFGDAPRATLTNDGQTKLGYGNAYRLERFIAGAWRKVSQPKNPDVYCAFTGELQIISPGESKSQRITVCDEHGNDQPLPAGRYRVTKWLTDESDSKVEERVMTRANFRVVRHSDRSQG